MQSLRVSEIYGPVIQGEGPVVGRPTIFVRMSGCNYRCDWCDTKYAVEPELIEEDDPDHLEPDEIVDEVELLNPSVSANGMTVTFSGGNPAIFNLKTTIIKLERKGYETVIETQGDPAQPWFSELSYVVLSPKGPSAGEHPNGVQKTPQSSVRNCIEEARPTDTFLKVVCFNEEDVQYAQSMHERFPDRPFFLQAGTIVEDADWKTNYQWLCDRVLDDPEFDKNVKILPQLHVAAFGGGREV